MKRWLAEKLKKFSAGDFGYAFFYLLLVLAALKIFGILFLWQFDNNLFFADVSRAVLVDLANKERKDLGIGELAESPQLDQAALLKARDMLKNGYFSHQSPQGVSPWYWFGRAGYAYQFAGENLGIGFLDSLELHQAWNESASHKANLVNPVYREVGIAVLKGDFQGNSGTTVVVQLFGAPQTKPLQLAPVNPLEKTEPSASAEPSLALGKSVAGQASAKVNFLRFMVENYDRWVSAFSFIALIITLLYLGYGSINDFHHRKKNILAACLCLLLAFTLLDKSVILKIIPHYSAIY
ncbi:MAG: CAP domain-containing protein [Candidatus Pacebacteria bacterium]|nr:CAP domain-containing protein [Candidatus Paceibacterota bacterium]